MSSSLIVIDSQVTDWQSLIADINPNTTILVLDSARDGLTQIAEATANTSHIDALHIISHGNIGSLHLGASTINSNNLNTYHDQLASIGNALSDNGDILLYGCEVAQGEIGQQFIEQLAAWTNATVAASSTLTGNAELGGDWLLDASTGAVTTQALAANNYQHTLTTAVFAATDGTGYKLWITDGTAAGTTLVKDINAGSISDSSVPLPLGFALGNGKVVFYATDATHGRELWITDGTAAGTTLVKDINAGASGSYPNSFTALGNGTVVFSASDATNGDELWVSDGTAAGTTLVKDINAGASNSSPHGFTALGNGKVVFQAFDATNGTELWVSDGTAAGTTLVKDIYAGASDSYPHGFTALGNGTVVFQATDATHGTELWVSDGTAAGTTLVKDINAGASNSSPHGFTALGNGTAVFTASDATNGVELWITDGTAAGTTLIKDIYAGRPDSYPSGFTALGNGTVVFQATDATHGTELWVSDGTAAGTTLVKDIYAGAISSSLHGFTALGNGKVVFQATDATNGLALWITDGTAAGTTLVKDITSGFSFTALGNGTAVFRGSDATNGAELWITDGTAAGTTLVKDINAGVLPSNPHGFTIVLGNANPPPVPPAPPIPPVPPVPPAPPVPPVINIDNTYIVHNTNVNPDFSVNYAMGDQVVDSNGGTDIIITDVSYALAPNSGIENLALAGNAISGFGNELNNVITGNAMDNILNGGGGANTLIGGAGNDYYFVSSSADVIIEQPNQGTDIVFSSASDYTLSDNVENLVIWGTGLNGTGNAGNNIIYGNELNNTLADGAGADFLIGGLGKDTYNLSVDSSTDTLLISAGDSLTSSYDVVNNFNLGATGTDRLDLPTTQIATDTPTVGSAIAGSSITGASISNGIISFQGVGGAAIAATAVSLNDAIAYIQANIVDGNTVAFVVGSDTFVFQDGGANDTLVDLVGVAATSISNTNAVAGGAVWII